MIRQVSKIIWPYGYLIFDKEAKTIHGKKDSIFNKWCWFNWTSACRRMQVDSFLSPCAKLKSKWIKELHIIPDTLKLIEEKVGKSLEYMGTGEKFLNRTATGSIFLIKVPSFQISLACAK
jgi:hypothetical protein